MLRTPAALLALLLAACAGAPLPAPAPAVAPDLSSSAACGAGTPIPPSIRARALAQFEEGRAAPPPDMTPEDLAAYRKSEAEQKARDWPNICRFRAANAALQAAPAEARQVVFMGDSITQNWEIALPDSFSNGVINRGISGQTSTQMLARFRSDVIALRPRAVHILAGVNDIAENTGPISLGDIEGNIASMVELARASGVKVVLATLPPAGGFPWAPAIRPARSIETLNAWIRAYAVEQGLVLADYYPALAGPDGAMRADLTLDGVHPNKAGYRVMRPIAETAIGAALH